MNAYSVILAMGLIKIVFVLLVKNKIVKIVQLIHLFAWIANPLIFLLVKIVVKLKILVKTIHTLNVILVHKLSFSPHIIVNLA